MFIERNRNQNRWRERGKLKGELDEMQTEHAAQLKEVREEHDKKMQKIAADVANRCAASTFRV